MPDSWIGGAVPLYMGCYNINDFKLPNNTYIDLRNFVKKQTHAKQIYLPQILQKLKSYTKKDYNNMINSINDHREEIEQRLSRENAYKKMIQVIEKIL
jgi:hypothetical protein